MNTAVKTLCVVLLVIMVLPVLYGFTPAPLNVRIQKVADKFNESAPSFPAFPTLDEEYINGATGLAKVFRSVIEFFKTFGLAFAWLFKVLWFFCKDIALAIQGANILIFNVGG